MNTRTPETEAVGLTRRYGEATVLDVENLHVSRGEAVALLGPNGAGKTTMVNILSTLIQPTAGTGRVLGHDVAHEAGAVRRLIGVTGPIVRPETGQTRRDSRSTAQRKPRGAVARILFWGFATPGRVPALNPSTAVEPGPTAPAASQAPATCAQHDSAPGHRQHPHGSSLNPHTNPGRTTGAPQAAVCNRSNLAPLPLVLVFPPHGDAGGRQPCHEQDDTASVHEEHDSCCGPERDQGEHPTCSATAEGKNC